MKITRVFFLVALLCITSCQEATTEASKPDLLGYVDPFVGTEDNSTEIHSVGNTHPGAVRPWGMVAVSPQSFDFTKMHKATGFRNEESRIYGFSGVNLSGVGCPAAGNIPLKFYTHPYDKDYAGSAFSSQEASPGYYGVYLEDEGIGVKTTATTRSGIYQLELPKGRSYVRLDLMAQQGHIKGGVVEEYSKSHASGYQLDGFFCGTKQRNTVFYHLELEKPADSAYLVYENRSSKQFNQGLDSLPSGIVYVYDLEQPGTRHVRFGASFVSAENAKGNLETEQSDKDFDQILKEAQQEWEDELGKIQITTDQTEDKKVFYTALYHALLMPMTFSDHNGEYLKMGSNEIGQTDFTRYTAFSLWDTYRTTHPLFTLVYPERQLDMIRTMLDIYEESGWLPKWSLFNYEANTMVGDPAPIVIGDSYLKGIDQFDVDLAYEAFQKHGNVIEDNLTRRGLKEYLELGYISMDGEFGDVSNFAWDNGIVWGPVSTTMEICLSDYTIAQVALKMGDTATYNTFMERSYNFMNYYNEKTGLFHPKNRDGSWFEPFDPTQKRYDKMRFSLRGGPGFVEGSAWQYMYSIPHGIDSLKQRMGEKRFEAHLDSLFEKRYFDITNEPGLGFPFMYNFTPSRKQKTPETVHRLLAEHFKPVPKGIPGNDDAGTMSAWVVFAMLGIYPDTPGSPHYQVSTPVVEMAEVKLNKDFYPTDGFIIKRDGPKDGIIDNMLYGGEKIDYQVSHQALTEKQDTLKIITTANKTSASLNN